MYLAISAIGRGRAGIGQLSGMVTANYVPSGKNGEACFGSSAFVRLRDIRCVAPVIAGVPVIIFSGSVALVVFFLSVLRIVVVT
jgi:hypothetical protein